MIFDDLNKAPVPTIPKDIKDPPLFAQPLETTKDAFTIELRKFFDRQYQTASRVEEIPTIKKYDISLSSSASSLETAVQLIQKHPSALENLPLIAVLGAVGRNRPMSINNQFVTAVSPRPSVLSSNTEPFILADGQTIQFKTTDVNGNNRVSTIILRQSRFVNMAAATATEVVREINFQALYANGVDSSGKVVLAYGGPGTTGTSGSIEIVGGTAIAALGFTIGQKSEYTNIVPYNRYIQSSNIDVALEVATEDENTRTEITDLIWAFFTFFITDRQSTLYGRSIFDNTISNETYQVIIKPDPSMSGEQEVPRPNTQLDKVYVNRINVSTITMQYIDRAVVLPGTTTPFYLDANGILRDESIPPRN